MSTFNPANFAPYAQTARQEERPQPALREEITAVALREAGNRWLKRHDQFADGKADTCFDMADKLDRFGGCILADSVGLGKTFEELDRQCHGCS